MVNTIKITSKLTSTQRSRIAREIERDLQRNYSKYPVQHVGRNLYQAIDNDEYLQFDPNDYARHLMVVAGTIFDYEII